MKISSKNLVIIFLIILFVFFLVLILKNKNTSNQENNSLKQEDIKEKEVVTYSRINFFLSSPNKASLAIPDFWEGNYRIKEQGSEATFYFVQGVSEEIKIFSISFHNKNEKVINTDEKILEEKNDLLFVFRNFHNDDFENEVFYKMKEGLSELVKSFKVSN